MECCCNKSAVKLTGLTTPGELHQMPGLPVSKQHGKICKLQEIRLTITSECKTVAGYEGFHAADLITIIKLPIKP
jgi:hypothetical protein